MDTLENIRTFLAVAKLGSFSAAAKSLNTVPSVITKRIQQLEHKCRAPLFSRSTRQVELTAHGRNFYENFSTLIVEVDRALEENVRTGTETAGRMKVKCPTTLAIHTFADVITSFQLEYPNISIDLFLVDRSVNPIDEGFDVAIGAFGNTYSHVVSVDLYPMKRVLVASPCYLARRGKPKHPRDLVEHDCLTLLTSGNIWYFRGKSGDINVSLNPRFSSSDSQIMARAVKRGLGIGNIAREFIKEDLDNGSVTELLTDFSIPSLYVKALIPDQRASDPAITEFIKWLQVQTSPMKVAG
ncbi:MULTISPECIES: LysR family transcriptional regulator [unclassified Sulfitobacter]|uniref:LysR family transcriptional regulator n=1 Tax=unclassified Sulfitobacter TaxID=196795 RepID=UPI0007C3CA28|nr:MULTISPECIES: LysR family transcriptional regulator [unclassified Sulfitobacter]KZX98477.1 hypothetical protein A3721_06385 [Sulfitobacter sp. HI0023]KZZ64297.1 hypothetical protein A3764_04690 [Sulfitobacter sp. HI0129]